MIAAATTGLRLELQTQMSFTSLASVTENSFPPSVSLAASTGLSLAVSLRQPLVLLPPQAHCFSKVTPVPGCVSGRDARGTGNRISFKSNYPLGLNCSLLSTPTQGSSMQAAGEMLNDPHSCLWCPLKVSVETSQPSAYFSGFHSLFFPKYLSMKKEAAVITFFLPV